MDGQGEEQGRERHRKWACQIIEEWDWFNSSYLGDALVPPVVAIAPGGSRLGHWQASTRTISIAAEHIANDPWVGVVETLRHEMAHQYVAEVLRAVDEPPHGPAFQAACKRLRVTSRATGTGAANPDDPVVRERQRVLRRVDKLLALGGSPNQHEAELALQMARSLLLEYNLSEQDRDGRQFQFRQLGSLTRRKHHYELLLAAVLSKFFFVKCIWTWSYIAAETKTAQVLEVHGTSTNLDLAEYVHGFVTALLGPLWRAHQANHGITRNRRRLEFFAGVVEGFYDSLRQQDSRLQEQALVWTGDPELDASYRWHYPRVGKSRSGSGQRTQTYYAGVREGQKVRLLWPIRDGSGQGGGTVSGLLGAGGE